MGGQKFIAPEISRMSPNSIHLLTSHDLIQRFKLAVISYHYLSVLWPSTTLTLRSDILRNAVSMAKNIVGCFKVPDPVPKPWRAEKEDSSFRRGFGIEFSKAIHRAPSPRRSRVLRPPLPCRFVQKGLAYLPASNANLHVVYHRHCKSR